MLKTIMSVMGPLLIAVGAFSLYDTYNRWQSGREWGTVFGAIIMPIIILIIGILWSKISDYIMEKAEQAKKKKEQSKPKKSSPYQNEHTQKIERHLEQIEQYIDSDRRARNEFKKKEGNLIRTLKQDRENMKEGMIKQMEAMIEEYDDLQDLITLRIDFFQEQAARLLQLQRQHELVEKLKIEQKALRKHQEKYQVKGAENAVFQNKVDEVVEHEGDYLEALDSLSDDIYDARTMISFKDLKKQFKDQVKL